MEQDQIFPDGLNVAGLRAGKRSIRTRANACIEIRPYRAIVANFHIHHRKLVNVETTVMLSMERIR